MLTSAFLMKENELVNAKNSAMMRNLALTRSMLMENHEIVQRLEDHNANLCLATNTLSVKSLSICSSGKISRATKAAEMFIGHDACSIDALCGAGGQSLALNCLATTSCLGRVDDSVHSSPPRMTHRASASCPPRMTHRASDSCLYIGGQEVLIQLAGHRVTSKPCSAKPTQSTAGIELFSVPSGDTLPVMLSEAGMNTESASSFGSDASSCGSELFDTRNINKGRIIIVDIPQKADAENGCGLSGFTTVMIRHVPRLYTQNELVAEFNHQGFDSKYDFLYLPKEFRSRSNRGFAFVNFGMPADAEAFYQMYHAGTLIRSTTKQKPLQVTVADIQGFELNVQRFLKPLRESRGLRPTPFILQLGMANERPCAGSKTTSQSESAQCVAPSAQQSKRNPVLECAIRPVAAFRNRGCTVMAHFASTRCVPARRCHALSAA